MPRSKSLPDVDVLDSAHQLIHRHGPEALTFASVAEACGLSASTLVQRFKTKSGLVQAALLRAWDKLDARTATLAAALPNRPEGAVAMLVALSGDYGGIDAYADGLLVLREDFRDPVLRARGAAWRAALCGALEERFAQTPQAPQGVGLLMASQWQGSLIWWGFDPRGDLKSFVEDGLRRFVSTIAPEDP